MSPLAISKSAPSTLPAVGFHLHGHRKGWQLESQGDSSNNSAAPVPVASLQDLFSNLLQTLQKAVGMQPAAATAATTAAAGAAGAAGAATSGTGGAAASSTGGAAAAAGVGHSFNNLVKGSRVNARV